MLSVQLFGIFKNCQVEHLGKHAASRLLQLFPLFRSSVYFEFQFPHASVVLNPVLPLGARNPQRKFGPGIRERKLAGTEPESRRKTGREGNLQNNTNELEQTGRPRASSALIL